MRNKKDNEKKRLYILLIFILSIIMGVIAIMNITNKNKPNEYSGIKWNGVRQINNPTEQKYIAVSGFTDLKFVADTTKQSVNFYNPKENNCLMDLSIVMQNGDVLWQAENIRPDYGLYTIDLCSPLKKGEYPACIVARFKTIDGGTKLNSATFKIKIIVGG